MHIKKFNGIEFHYIAPDSNLDEILSAIKYLKKQIEEIDSYPDKSLFFQNPLVIEGWLALVRAIESNTVRDFPDTFEGLDEWSKRTEPFLSFLLGMRELHMNYQNLYKSYYNQLKELLDGYGGWIEGVCISKESIEALVDDRYEKEMAEVNDLTQFLEELNSKSLNARNGVYMTLSDISNVIMTVMNRGAMIVIGLNPSLEAFEIAINYDLREWTIHFGSDLFKSMKEDLNRHFKDYRTAPYTPELWGQLLDSDEDALNMAKRQELATCNDVKQEHWGEDMRKQMDENGELMRLIYTSCHTEELFDFGKVENVQPLIELLTQDNLPMFYDIIVRRNLIQCEMFPELKKQHEKWLHPSEGQTAESDDIEINDKSKEYDNTNQQNVNITTPRIVLQQLLQQEWFESVCMDKKQYSKEWRDKLVIDLMASEYGVYIARLWEHQDKIQTIKAKFIGALILAGVLKDNKLAASRAILGIDKNTRDEDEKKEASTFANYMGQGRNEPYVEWIKEYVAKSKR